VDCGGRGDAGADHVRLDSIVSEGLAKSFAGENVGMIQLSGGARFTFEAGAPVGLGAKIGRKNFQGDFAFELRIAGPVDFAHPAGTERCDDLIAA